MGVVGAHFDHGGVSHSKELAQLRAHVHAARAQLKQQLQQAQVGSSKSAMTDIQDDLHVWY